MRKGLEAKKSLLARLTTYALIFASFAFSSNFQTEASAIATCANGGTCVVGDTGPAGGIVIYVGSSIIDVAAGISSGGKYLEAAPSDFPTTVFNWCDGPNNGNTTLIGAGDASLGAGASNTAVMVAQCTGGAGNFAASYVKNGYSDWFLPSGTELMYLSVEKDVVGLNHSSLYWGSNEPATWIAASLVTSNGGIGGQNKAQATPLWAIRAFSPGDPLPASKLVVSVASTGTARDMAFTTQPQISIEDSAGNLVSSFSGDITASISSGGRLIGSSTTTAASGIATFSDLGVDGTVGSTYTITYSSIGLASTTSTVTLTSSPIGEIGPGGGKVFYYSQAGFSCGATLADTCNYLEAAPSTWYDGTADPAFAWSGNVTTHVDTTSNDIGAGLFNAGLIIAQSSRVESATVDRAETSARRYNGGGKSDWYLPTRFELNQFTYQQSIIGGLNGDYWSSTEMGSNMSWYQYFPSTGFNGGYRDKADVIHVRPVRAFGISTITSAAVSGVTPPARGATPVTVVTTGNGISGTVSWSGSPSTFSPATVYTATITLAPTVGYTLTGVTSNFFTVSGATSVSNLANSGIVTAIFPATAAAPPPLLAPHISLSQTSETATVGSSISGFSIVSTGGLVATYAISPSINNGLNFDPTTGLISGVPIAAASARTYTVTGTNATSSSSATYTITVNAPTVTIASGSAPNSQVATIPTGITTASIPATAALPATTLSFSGSVPTTVTIVPTPSNPAPSAATPFTILGSTKIVDIQISGTFSGTATVCLDGSPTDHIYHFTGGVWVELPSRTYVGGQVCGVTTSFSPFTVATPVSLVALPVPDPVQQSKISGISPSLGISGNPTAVSISGTFIEKVSNIQVGEAMISAGSWVQTSNSISFTVPGKSAGLYSIQIYNGSAPVLKALSFTFASPVVTAAPTSTVVVRPKLTYLRCAKPGHGTRITYGIDPVCPAGYQTKY